MNTYIISNKPTAYRLATHGGVTVMQGLFERADQRGDHSAEWIDLPTVDLDAPPGDDTPTDPAPLPTA